MQQKRFVIVVVVLMVVFIGVAGYFTLIKKPFFLLQNKNSPQQSSETKNLKVIEKIDFQKYFVESQKWSDCSPNTIKIGGVIYGDLTGDGTEEAVVKYWTCYSGTGGASESVYKLNAQGELVDISPDETKLSASEYEKFYGGHDLHSGDYEIRDSKLVYYFNLLNAKDPQSDGGQKTITFYWDGNEFIHEKVVTELPPGL